MDKTYEKVIDIIANNPDWKEIALAIAKTHPYVFIDAHEAGKHAQFLPEMKRLIADDRVVEAIKYVRACSGWGLKEAKDFVDGYREPRFV